MVTASMYDGFRTIDFNGFDEVLPTWQSTKLFKGEKIGGAGQEIKDGGTRSERYIFEFTLKTDSDYPTGVNSQSAYQKWEDLQFMLNTASKKYGYQRKITFEKPDTSGTESINGKVTKPVSMPFNAGDDEIIVESKIEFALDSISTQVP